MFGDARHIPLMTLPGMRERTLRIGSAGKTFSLTGWKVGYITAPPALLRPIAKAHQFVTFTTPPNLQHAVALGLGKDDAYFAGLGAPLARSRDRLAGGPGRARDAGAAVRRHLLPRARRLALAARRTRTTSRSAAGWSIEAGVVLIPMSAFYERAAAPPGPRLLLQGGRDDRRGARAAARLGRPPARLAGRVRPATVNEVAVKKAGRFAARRTR